MFSFAIGVLALQAGVSGLFPLFVVISFFSFVINSFPGLFGHKYDNAKRVNLENDCQKLL